MLLMKSMKEKNVFYPWLSRLYIFNNSGIYSAFVRII
jgi:hypothetical protein